MSADTCPTNDALDQFSRGELPRAEMDAIAAHVVRCAVCDEKAANLAHRNQLTEVRTVVPVSPVGSNATPVGAILADRYVLGDRLGVGGMGYVYKAQQVRPVRRTVAVKVLKPGLDTDDFLARFETERQAVARMDHPHIARVYDAGTTADSRPFFALELIDGPSIVRYADAQKLTTRQRVELFVPVCRAIQHAHQKGVIHRDLKPSNILVTEVDGKPVPKVIDFGIAKAVNEHRFDPAAAATKAGVMIGTPEYMSPEQADLSGGDVDTRSDVYSLGVVLYELLAGTTPFTSRESGGSVWELLRRIREVDPPVPLAKLSEPTTVTAVAADRQTNPPQLRQELSGELEWVVMKALERDRERRYQSANNLAIELGRYLRNEPLEAGPPSRTYRLRKFVRRHRTAVLAAAVVTVALTSGAVASTAGLIISRQAEQRAVSALRAEEEARVSAEESARREREEREKATVAEQRAIELSGKALAADRRSREALFALTDYVVEGFVGRSRRPTPSEERFLNEIGQLLERLAKESPDDVVTRSQCRDRLGQIQLQVGQLREAETSFRTALDELDAAHRTAPKEPLRREWIARISIELGSLLARTNRRAEGERCCLRAVELADELVAESATPGRRSLLAKVRGQWGNHLGRSGSPDKAVEQLKLAETVLVGLHREVPTDPKRRFDLAVNHDLLAVNYDQMRMDADAIREWDAARGLFDALIREQPDMTDYQMSQARVYSSLARTVGRNDETRANEYYVRAIGIRRRLMADNPGVPQYANDFAASAANYAGRLLDSSKLDKAESYARDALAIRERLAADFPTVSTYTCYLAHSLCVLSELARRRGNPDEAVKLVTRGIELIERVYQQDPTRNLAVEIFGMCLASRADLLDDRKKHADAVADWQRAVKLRRNDDWASAYVLSLARVGNHTDAVRAAATFEKSKSHPPSASERLSRAFAVMAAATTDPDAKEQYAKRAVRYLGEVLKAGRRSPNQILAEPDFAGLCEREDFRGAVRERLPSPRPL